jgi:hypothetical protein
MYARVSCPAARTDRPTVLSSDVAGTSDAREPSGEIAVAVRVTSNAKTKTTKIQFVLPEDVHDGPVSAVGTFNGWRPGAHKLVRRSNGTRSVSVTVPAGQDVTFRYLGSGGRWFDDPEVPTASEGGVVRS